MGQGNPLCTVHPLLVWTPMFKLVGHLFDQNLIVPGHPANSAHLPIPSFCIIHVEKAQNRQLVLFYQKSQ